VDAERQRADRFLWHARVVRTRVLAAKLAASGHVRVNGQRIDAAGRALKIGDVLTVTMPGGVRVLKVLAFAPRRGSSSDAHGLYEDLAPAPVKRVIEPMPAQRRAGGRRPTKRDRRAVERLQRLFE
jgi:ribosome-associated heat shock protein Hsp15